MQFMALIYSSEAAGDDVDFPTLIEQYGKFGEEVCSWAIAKTGTELTEEDLKSFCKGQIAHFKVPKHIRVVTELPMTITGKPQKFVMREKMIEMLGL